MALLQDTAIARIVGCVGVHGLPYVRANAEIVSNAMNDTATVLHIHEEAGVLVSMGTDCMHCSNFCFKRQVPCTVIFETLVLLTAS